MAITSSEFYLARAAENALGAETATLANVRERCLRAEAAWRLMADGEATREAYRAELAEKAETAKEARARA